MLKISNNKPCIKSKSKFDFLQAVKWKMSEFLYFHGLIMTSSKYNGEFIYEISFNEVTDVRTDKKICVSEHKELIDRLQSRFYPSGKVIIPESQLEKDNSFSFFI